MHVQHPAASSDAWRARAFINFRETTRFSQGRKADSHYRHVRLIFTAETTARLNNPIDAWANNKFQRQMHSLMSRYDASSKLCTVPEEQRMKQARKSSDNFHGKSQEPIIHGVWINYRWKFYKPRHISRVSLVPRVLCSLVGYE